MMGLSVASARPLVNEVPTSSEPSRPGPRVKAMASTSAIVTPAIFRASETTGRMFCWWAREASSGITPP